ncbi:MAG: alpha/beta hydrolase, partial [Stellaceae bacterium]
MLVATVVLAALIHAQVHDRTLLHPPPRPPLTLWRAPAPAGAIRRPVSLTTRDDVTLSGWLYPVADGQAPWVLCFGSTRSDLAREAPRLRWLQSLGYNAVGFDYRGYGFSGGKPDGAAMRRDVVALYDEVARKLAPSGAKIVVEGLAVGSQFAIHVAAVRPVAGMILQSPLSSAQAQVAWYQHHGAGLLGKIVHYEPSQGWETLVQGEREIREVHAPLLVIHGTDDEIVPIGEGQAVFAASPATDKEFVPVLGAHHDDIGFSGGVVGEATAAFLHKLGEA